MNPLQTLGVRELLRVQGGSDKNLCVRQFFKHARVVGKINNGHLRPASANRVAQLRLGAPLAEDMLNTNQQFRFRWTKPLGFARGHLQENAQVGAGHFGGALLADDAKERGRDVAQSAAGFQFQLFVFGYENQRDATRSATIPFSIWNTLPQPCFVRRSSAF